MDIPAAHLGGGIRAFGLDTMVHWVRTAQAANPDCALISVGSGNGALESQIGALCVDPDPLSYKVTCRDLAEPYCAPSYANVEALIAAQPQLVGNAVLLLIWCNPNDSTYDYEAIQQLKPRAVVSLYELFYGGAGAAGGKRFHEWRADVAPCGVSASASAAPPYRLIQEACLDPSEVDVRLGWWQRDAPVATDLPAVYPARVALRDPVCCVQ